MYCEEEYQKLMDRMKQSFKEPDSSRFVPDGIINLQRWNEAPRKILFLLKEPTSCDYDSLPELLDIRPEPLTLWENVARWAYCIQKTTKSSIPEYPDDSADCNKEFKASAVMNIKKVAKNIDEEKTSNMSDLYEWCEANKDGLAEQIRLINPDIIYCAYTLKCLDIILGFKKEDRPQRTLCDGVLKYDNRIVIDYYHPSRYGIKDWSRISYETIGSRLQNVLKQGVIIGNS